MVIAFTMFFMHPVSLGISLGSALAYAVYLRGRKAIRFSLVFMLPMMAMAALINPAFNHEGATLLTYLPSGNPLTLESILYGLAAAAMLAAEVTWFSCYTAVMTSDKFVWKAHTGSLAGAEHGTAVCPKVPGPIPRCVGGAAMHRTGCLRWWGYPADSKRCHDFLHHAYLEPGKCN